MQPGQFLASCFVHARKSAAWSIDQSKKVRAGAPVSSRTVDDTNAGWPIPAAHASSSIFRMGAGIGNSRCA